MTEVTSADLIRLIGSPFNRNFSHSASDEFLARVYEKAFYNRIAPLYLHKYKRKDWSAKLEDYFQAVKNREDMTIKVLSELAQNLNEWNENGYVIFKSIKPYPSIPNDTDVLIFGGKKEFNSTLAHLHERGYIFHEWAPMQTTLYDPRGRGKIGVGKKGGTYYIDIYREISTDYVCYLSESAIRPQVMLTQINGINVRVLRREPELAVILFHNVFPERTFQLEHFYMTLYYLADSEFNIDLFVCFTEENSMLYAIKTNLSIVERVHEINFGFTPTKLTKLLDHWGRNEKEVQRFMSKGMETPYLFTAKTFWATCMIKLGDKAFLKSLFIQAFHMLNPIFFIDVVKSLKNRMSERGTYHLE